MPTHKRDGVRGRPCAISHLAVLTTGAGPGRARATHQGPSGKGVRSRPQEDRRRRRHEPKWEAKRRMTQTLTSLEQVLVSRHLSPPIAAACRRLGLNPDATRPEIDLWVASRRPLGADAARALELRIEGVPVGQAATVLGVGHHGRVQQLADGALIRVLAPHLPTVPAWVRALEADETSAEVARMANVEP